MGMVNYNIQPIHKGATCEQIEFTILDDDLNAVNLSGYAFTANFFLNPFSLNPTETFTLGNGLSITSSVGGTVAIDAQPIDWVAGTYRYNLLITNPDGITKVWASGIWEIWETSILNVVPPPQNGRDGTNGTNGTNGSVWRDGSGVPSNSLGVNGDYYLNDANGDVYLKSAGVYAVVANIKGAAGSNGSVWRNGTGAPSSGLGANGDYYLNNTNGDVYLKDAGTYSVTANIKGTTGAQGAAGSYTKADLSSQAVTGTTTQTILHTITLTNGWLAANDVLDVYCRGERSGTTSNISIRILLNTSAVVAGATTVAVYTISTTNKNALLKRRIPLRSLTVQKIFSNSLATAPSDEVVTTSALFDLNYNFGQTVYLMFTAQLVNTADTFTASDTVVTKYTPS